MMVVTEMAKTVTNILKLSPTSVTNIDVAKTYQCTHIHLYIRTQMIQQYFCKCDRFALRLKVKYLIFVLILTVQV